MEPPVKDHFNLVGTTLENRFAIERVVAQGGFGVVYQGRHLSLRKPIAVKVLFIPPDLGETGRKVFLDGFELEAQTIANLDHPAIVRMLDFGVSRASDGKEMPWMVMEWIEGNSLGHFLEGRNGKPMSPREALTILRPVFQALAFAHEQHIAHRDIKPSNIMLLAARGGSQTGLTTTKLLDFGIAKVMNSEEAAGSGETRTHALFAMFSLPYAAPEQKIGMKTGPWSDVHALGLIVTELLTGKPPYPGSDRIEVEQRVMASTRPTPAMFYVDVGPWEPVIARAVALRTPDRFQDAASFLSALEAYVPSDDEVHHHTPPPATESPSSVSVSFGGTGASGSRALGVPAATITGSPFSAPIAPAQPAPNRRLVAAAGVGAVMAAIVGTIAWIVLSPSSEAPRATADGPAVAARPPPPAPARAVAPVAHAPAPVAAPTQAALAAPIVRAAPTPAPSAVEQPPEPDARSRHGHGSHHGHGRRPD